MTAASTRRGKAGLHGSSMLLAPTPPRDARAAASGRLYTLCAGKLDPAVNDVKEAPCQRSVRARTPKRALDRSHRVVGRLAGDRDVVRMRFAETRHRDPNEIGLRAELVDRS